LPHSFDAGDELVGTERLHDVIVCADGQPDHLGVDPGSYDNHWNVADRATDVEYRCRPCRVAAFGHRATSIRTGIGRVRAGAAGAVLAALRAVVGGRDGIHHLSTRDEETGVWLGQPVGLAAGQATTRLPALTKAEHEQFVYAGKKLARAYATVATKISVETPVEEITP
jgi:hypothetical protein